MASLDMASSHTQSGVSTTQKEGDYFLVDDEALKRLLQRAKELGDPGLQQRLKDAGEPDTGLISKGAFVRWLQKIGISAMDIQSI